MPPADRTEEGSPPGSDEFGLGGLRLWPLTSGLYSPDTVSKTIRASNC